MISITFVTYCNKATVHAFTSRRTNFPSFKKPHVTTGKIPVSLRGGGILFCEERTSRESVEAIYPSRWARVRGPTHTQTDTRIQRRDEEARKVESGSPRCHAGCAKGDEGSVPAPFVGAIRPPPPHPPPPPSIPFPSYPDGKPAGALHFRVLQPAGVAKEMKTMRYSGHPLPYARRVS